MLRDKALRMWDKFYTLFKPLEDYIDFYLLQLPPRFKPREEYAKRLERFIYYVNLGYRLAIEWRDEGWFSNEWLEWGREHEVTVVSIDSPIGNFYVRSGPYIYLRMHGRTNWYAYRYSYEELVDVAKKLIKLNGSSIYVFFNNNHDMLDNARELLKIFHLIERGE